MSLAGLNGGTRGEPTYLRHSNVVHHLHQTSIWQRLVTLSGPRKGPTD